ncbi:recombinase family protein [Nonomuraea angiospora]|uniref:recombinase family protein n=1 Tax=Nonomuraea angiospora TaxID=46172 RepID=UPI0034388A75
MRQVGGDPIFSEKISTRIKARPEFGKAMDYARTIKQAVPHERVIFTVHKMKRLASGAADLPAIAGELRHHDIELELLTGPLQGIYHSSGRGVALLAFFVAGMAESEREYVRECPRARQARRTAAGAGRRHDRLRPDTARARRGRPDIARKLVIPVGKNQGRHPSVASVYRALADVDAASADQ